MCKPSIMLFLSLFLLVALCSQAQAGGLYELTLSNQTIAENVAPGTVVGLLSAKDASSSTQTQVYCLVAGEGSDDNGAFSIVKGVLSINLTPNYEAQKHYFIRVKGEDGLGGLCEQRFVIDVQDRNEAPTSILLSNNKILENQPAGTVIGELSAVDPESSDTHTFYADSNWVKIDGNKLKTKASFNYEGYTFMYKNFTVDISCVDSQGNRIARPVRLTIQILNEREGPQVYGPGSLKLYENHLENSLGSYDLRVRVQDVRELTSATVWISQGFMEGDWIDYHPYPGVSVQYDPRTGVLSITGQADVDTYNYIFSWLKYHTTREELSAPAEYRRFSVAVSDGEMRSNTLEINAELLAENDLPQMSDFETTVTMGENTLNKQGWSPFPNAKLFDRDSNNFAGGVLGVSLRPSTQDVQYFGVEITCQGNGPGQISVSELTTVTYGGLPIATLSTGSYMQSGGKTYWRNMTAKLNANASLEAVQALIRSLHFHSDDDDFKPMSYALWIVISDDDPKPDGGCPVYQSYGAVCQVTPENDPPYLGVIEPYWILAPKDAPWGTGDSISWTIHEDNEGGPLQMKVYAGDVERLTTNTITWSVPVKPLHGEAWFEPGPNDFQYVRYQPAPNYNGQEDFVIQASDGMGGNTTVSVHLIIKEMDDPPTSITLSNQTIAENCPAGTMVGYFSAFAPDTENRLSYYLVNEPGYDNNAFAIDVDQLTTKDAIDYEAKSFLKILVEAKDVRGVSTRKEFLISVQNVNDEPTSLTLSSLSVAENQPAGAVVGLLSAVDQDASDTLTFSCVSDRFVIEGNQLKTRGVLDYERCGPGYNFPVSITCRDAQGLSVAKSFMIAVVNEREAPVVEGGIYQDLNENAYMNLFGWDLLFKTQDTTDLTSATVWVSKGFMDGDLIEADTSIDGIAFSYDAHAGALSMTGRASTEQYTRVLRGLLYHIKREELTSTTEHLTFSIAAYDGLMRSETYNVDARVVAENDPPRLTDYETSVTLGERSFKGVAHYPFAHAKLTDSDSKIFAGGELLINIQLIGMTSGAMYDEIKVRKQGFGEGQIGIIKGTPESFGRDELTYGGEPFALIWWGTSYVHIEYDETTQLEPNGPAFAELHILFNSNATIEAVQALIQNVYFYNNTDEFASGQRRINFALWDEPPRPYGISLGCGGIIWHTVFPENDPPYLAVDEPQKMIAPRNSILGDGDSVAFSIPEDNNLQAFGMRVHAWDVDHDTTPILWSVPVTPQHGRAWFEPADNDHRHVRYEPDVNYHGPDEFVIQASDGIGGDTTVSVSLNILPVEDAPTSLALSNAMAPENCPLGTVVGRLSAFDPETPEQLTFQLAEAPGYDNGAFVIEGDQLKTNAALDYETKASYKIQVKVLAANDSPTTKEFVIAVQNVNDAPTSLTLNHAVIFENQPAGAVVGTISATDADGNPLTYSFVSGEGDADNAVFKISGAQLLSAAPFNFEAKQSYQVRVQAADGQGGVTAKAFTITVADVNEAPKTITLSRAFVEEKQTWGSLVGVLGVADEDSSDTHVYSLASGEGDADNDRFLLSSNRLLTGEVFDFETTATYHVRLEVTDRQGARLAARFVIAVTDNNDAPTSIGLSKYSVLDAQSAGTTIATLLTEDQDTSDTHVYKLVAGEGDKDNSAVKIEGNQLKTAVVLSSLTSPTLCLRVQSDDGRGGVTSRSLTVRVDPMDIAAPELTIAPYVEAITTASATVRWRTDEPTKAMVRYGKNGQTESTIQVDTLTTSGLAHLSGLDPMTSYTVVVEVDDRYGNGPTVSQPVALRTMRPPDLGVTLAARGSANTYYPGSTNQFQIECVNRGGGGAEGTRLTLTLPAQVQLAVGDAQTTWSSQGDGVYACELGQVAAGGSRQLTFALALDAKIQGQLFSISLTVADNGTQGADPNLVDNRSMFAHDIVYPTGTVVIQPRPLSRATVAWKLTGPEGRSWEGQGAKTMPNMPIGDYSILWRDVYGYETPAAGVGDLTKDQILTLTGEYRPKTSAFLTASLPDNPAQVSIGSQLRVSWKSDVQFTGTAVLFELWRGGARVGELGQAWSPAGEQTSQILIPVLPGGAGYSLRVVSSYLRDFWVELPAFEIVDKPVTVSLSGGARELRTSDCLTVRWSLNRPKAGTAARIELWNAAGRVAVLKQDWLTGTQSETISEVVIPAIASGSDYRIRVISIYNPELWAESLERLTINRTGVASKAWRRYE